jgi:hypothetical protein
MPEEFRNRILLYVLNSGRTTAPPCRGAGPHPTARVTGGGTTSYPQVREDPRPAP